MNSRCLRKFRGGLYPSPEGPGFTPSGINRGTIAEAFAGQELLAYAHPLREGALFFWRRAEKSSSAAVDYLQEKDQMVIPIEIKSGHAGTLKSMHLFLKERPKTSYGIRFSAQNYSRFEKIDSRPLYAIATLAHEDQKPGLRALK